MCFKWETSKGLLTGVRVLGSERSIDVRKLDAVTRLSKVACLRLDTVLDKIAARIHAQKYILDMSDGEVYK